MRSNSYNANKAKKKKQPKKKVKKETVSEDFLSEFRQGSGNNLDYSDKKKKNGKPKKYKKNGKPKRRKWPYILLIILILAGSGAFAAYKFFDKQVNKLNKVEVDKSEFEIDANVAKDLKNYTNIAVLGVDAREGQDASTSRTDAIIIVTIDNETGNLSLTSVMRDSYMEMYDKEGQTITDKATHAHAFKGPVNTSAMLNKNLDLNIDSFVVVDWDSVADVVDVLGGIEVDVQANEIGDLNKWGPETAANTGRKWTRIKSTGKQTINGVQAATYCRIRYNSGGDQGRTERMQKVLTAMFASLKSQPGKIDELTDKVFPEITTNMGTSDFLSLVPKALDLEITASHSYPFDYWGGKVDGVWYAVPTTLEENIVTLHEKLFNQQGYVPTERALKISNKIVNETGVSEGTGVNE